MSVVAMPNVQTDSVRRFTVVSVNHKPQKGRAWVSDFLVRDRCGFLPDTPFPVAKPGGDKERRPATDATDAARSAAEEHRRNLNICELNGHNFSSSDLLHCIQCGVLP